MLREVRSRMKHGRRVTGNYIGESRQIPFTGESTHTGFYTIPVYSKSYLLNSLELRTLERLYY